MSLRLRLTLWYGLLLALSLLAFGSLLYVVLRVNLERQLDDALRLRAAQVGRALSIGPNGLLDPTDLERTPLEPLSVEQMVGPDLFVQVLDQRARLLGTARGQLPIDPETVIKALEGQDTDMGIKSVLKLAEALDSYIPTPKREIDKPFLMPVEDVFSISGRGTVVTGRVERGVVKVGDELEIVGIKPTQKTVCTGVEMFRKLLDEGQAGDNVGVLLRGTKREEVERGQVLAKPGSITPHAKFECEVYVLSKEEGGRHTPFFNNYRPQFYFRTTDVTGSVELPAGTEMVMPGDNIKMIVTLITPVAMEQGLRFAIREGGKTVGAGVVAKVIE